MNDKLDYLAAKLGNAWTLFGACTGCGDPVMTDTAGGAFVCERCRTATGSGGARVRTCSLCGYAMADHDPTKPHPVHTLSPITGFNRLAQAPYCPSPDRGVCGDCWRPLGDDWDVVGYGPMGLVHLQGPPVCRDSEDAEEPTLYDGRNIPMMSRWLARQVRATFEVGGYVGFGERTLPLTYPWEGKR